MVDAFIYDHVRTPRGRGKPDGSLHTASTLHLAATALKAIKDRNNLDPLDVDDVVMGCVDPIGEAGGDIARMGALAAGFGQTVPGVQINRFCASGLNSINFAASQVMGGQHDMTIGGGVESMSRVGIGASGGAWPADPSLAIPAYFMPQGVSADLIATKYGFSRDDVDAYAVESQKRAAAALERGPVQAFDRARPRRQRPLAARPRRAHAAQHRHAVARLAQAVLCRPRRARRLRRGGDSGLSGNRAHHPCPSRRQFVWHRRRGGGGALGFAGSRREGRPQAPCENPRLRQYRLGARDHADGPVDVTKKVLARSGMAIDDIDFFEVNEAFAAVVLRFLQAFEVDPKKVNVNGGAIAMGHPLGATGAMILGTALDELERTGKSTALITLCIGGGMGTATIIERV